MPKVFVSHSSDDRTVVASFVHLLEDGIGFDRSEIRCSSLPGYGFSLGSPFRDAIRDDVRAADAVIALVSSSFVTSAYCMGEIGIAWGLDKTILPLLLPNVGPADVRGPMESLNVSRIADGSALDALWEQLGAGLPRSPDPVRWQDRRDQFLGSLHQLPSSNAGAWQDRGFWRGSVVDGALSVPADPPTTNLRQQVLSALESGRPLPPHLFYVTDQGVSRWLALSEDPLFVAYQDSMELLFGHSDEIASEILGLVGTKNMDLVSLGPGDGRKDAAIIGSMLRAGGSRGELFYYPYDISPIMVAKTMDRIGRDRVIRRGLAHAKAVIADFDALPLFRPVYQYREGPNVLMLLGNILGNFSDDFGFLRRLHDHALFVDDALLLEVRLRSESSERVLRNLKDRDWPRSARFDFVPLELLGVPFREDDLSYRFEPDRGTIRGSDTIVARYAHPVVNGRRFGEVDLSYVHRYEEEQLLSEVRRAGYGILKTWTSPKRHNLWLLLQKKERSS